MKTLFLLACLGLPLYSASDSAVPKELAELVQKIDAKTETIGTIRAKFHQRKELTLMAEPIEMSGTFFLKKPDGIKFSAVPEDDLILVMTETEVVSLSPKVKKATRIKLKKRRDFLTQTLLSKKLEAMLPYFSITRFKNTDQDGNHRLVLKPLKRKFKKKFTKVQLWVNADYLIYKVHVHDQNGDINKLELSDIEVNVDIDSKEFATTIPAGYEMGDRISSILGSEFGF